jgi:hypothetical protein
MGKAKNARLRRLRSLQSRRESALLIKGREHEISAIYEQRAIRLGGI